MTAVNLKEARRRLSELVRAAEHGQATILTRRGRRVAQLAPPGSKTRKPFVDLAALRASVTVKGRPMSETVIAARREARY
ncbi:MAG: type II toxin-antitoxin system prevent-host-death family antitoxin [Planctomycetes bacterium]|nr:type II toxin-antitoxin system prevent-host-death family antitoxin [Planctomycetota bacterium]